MAAGSTPALVASNVDIAPTILELAGAQAPATMDGKSFAHALVPGAFDAVEVESRSDAWRTGVISEYWALHKYVLIFRILLFVVRCSLF